MRTFKNLKTKHRAEREGYPTNMSLRVHRALSWLQRAEQCEDDDGRFVFLWISFNAAYAQEIYDQERTSERTKLGDFLSKIVALDENDTLYETMWQQFSSTVRVLLRNPFVFGAYWDFQRGLTTEQEWSQAFERANNAANQALAHKDTATLLGVVMSRLYILRNQLVHGGANWNSSINREQLRDATKILAVLVPAIIEIMMCHPNVLWGDPVYPVVEAR